MTRDEQLNWRLCEDVLPNRRQVCICTDGESVFLAEWEDGTPDGLSGWEIHGMTGEPIAWMPLPPIPKFE